MSRSASLNLFERYRELLARPGEQFPLTLGEGNTPLIHARNLGSKLGLRQLYLKFEGLNPTGSFKDRGMALALNRALTSGARAVVCASTGNTSASAGAYAAAAGLPCLVVLPAGYVARGKLAQAEAVGARLVMIDGSFDDALEVVRQLGTADEIAVVNSTNPDRLDGQQTAAWEIIDTLGRAPDVLALPVGNAGNITAYWRGFRSYADAGRGDGRSLPRLAGFQAAGAAPIVDGKIVKYPETIATAIRIGNPASWQQAITARDESGGVIEAVSDEKILAAQADIARYEGVFCEPASASSIAGIRQMAQDGRLQPDETIVAVLTGHGLKDPDALADSVQQLSVIIPDADAIRLLLEL